jgi:hypothetical protein
VIISHKYKFIFIKTRKTAGTSIEVFLSAVCDKQDVLTPIYPAVEGHVPRNYGDFFNHVYASEVRSAVSDTIWQSYFKFCVERNPWEKTLSYFYMQRALSGNTLTLDEYMLSQDFCTDYASYTEPNDNSKIIVDRVLQYEGLMRELSEVFGMLGVPFDGDLGVRAKSEYRTDKRHYKDVLSAKHAKIIEEKFRNEIELFGYEY